VSNTNYQHISDTDLLLRFNNDRNKEWLGILLERYTLLLLGVCMKYLKDEEDAKDAVQQIFMKALNELEKYTVTYPKSWLYKIACNHCLMKLRDEKQVVSLSEHSAYVDENVDVEALQFKEINLNLLESCLTELNIEQQTCITLFYLQKSSYQEITQKTGYSILQVKSNIQNGKRNLKLLIAKKRNQLND
jgi:RNA polymerase sigma-70 factor (ECF subfamily)